MGKYQMTVQRATDVLAFKGVPSRQEGLINLLRAAGLQHLSGNGQKRGFSLQEGQHPETIDDQKKPLPLKDCPKEQLYAAARRMYNLARAYIPEIARINREEQELINREQQYLRSPEYRAERCSEEWRGKLSDWLNLDRDQSRNYSTEDLEGMLCGE